MAPKELCDRSAERALTRSVEVSPRSMDVPPPSSTRENTSATQLGAQLCETAAVSSSSVPSKNDFNCPASRSQAVLCTGAISGIGAMAPIITDVPFTSVVRLPALMPWRRSQIVAS